MCGLSACAKLANFSHFSFSLFQSELVQWLLSASPKARPNATEVRNSELLKQIRHAIKTSNTDSIRSVTL